MHSRRCAIPCSIHWSKVRAVRKFLFIRSRKVSAKSQLKKRGQTSESPMADGMHTLHDATMADFKSDTTEVK